MPEPRATWRMDVGEVRARIEQGKPFVYESDQLACLGQFVDALDAAEARIAELEREQMQGLAGFERVTYEGMAWKDRAEAAEAALAAQAWVPCSERMPTNRSDQYLVTGHGRPWGNEAPVPYVRCADWYGAGWVGEWTVLAWRPLPAPWEGE